MDWNNFGKSILENIIANIPQIVLTLNVLLINIAKIKNQVKVFKGQVETTEENLTKQINVEVRTLLAHTDKRIDTSLEKFNVSLSVFNEKTEDLDNRIHNVETLQEQVLTALVLQRYAFRDKKSMGWKEIKAYWKDEIRKEKEKSRLAKEKRLLKKQERKRS